MRPVSKMHPTPELINALVELHNATRSAISRSPTVRTVCPDLVRLIQEIEELCRGASTKKNPGNLDPT